MSASRGRRPAPSTREPPARTRLDVDERRRQLVAQGLELFAARSYDEVSIDELAVAAGISKGLLYHYFPTKRDFYVATVRESARQLLELTDTPPEADPLARLRAGLDAYLDYVTAHGAAYAALLRSGIGNDGEVARVVDETREAFCARLVSGMPLDPTSPRLRLALRGCIGFVEAATLEWLASPRIVTRTELREMLAGVLLATSGVVVGPAPGP